MLKHFLVFYILDQSLHFFCIVISFTRIIFDLNFIFKLVLHACVNSHLVSNFKFTTIMELTMSDIFRINHEQNTAYQFETTKLGVVRYALTQPEGTKDWRMTVIFHTYIKCGDKGYKIIIDNGSCINGMIIIDNENCINTISSNIIGMIIIDNENCINTISSNIIDHLGLKIVPHLKPYNVSWVNNNSIVVNEKCLFHMKLLDYHEEIWCDEIPMDIEHVIFRRPWIYDLDVIIFC